MKVGAEPKKLVVLGGLVLVGGYFLYSNVLSSPSGAPEEKPRAAAAKPDPDLTPASLPQSKTPVIRGVVRGAGGRMRNTEEFRPSLKPPREEDRPDPMSIDPTLRLDLLSKVQAVELQGGQRDLFRFSTAPPPPLTGKEPIVKPKTPAEIAKEQQMKPAGPPQPPPPPPILLKYYGYSSARADGRKKAFFLDGEDILVGAEGELVKKRYRVVHINVNSVVMEDVQNQHQQTLPLVEESVG